MGEAYFYGLAERFHEPHEREKLRLMAQVERYAAEAVRPLLIKHGLTPRPDQELEEIGKSWIEKHQEFEWNSLISDIAERYIGYLDDFHALEEIAPENDLPALNILTDHEVVAIEFAKLEIAGNPDSTQPLKQYMSK